MRAETQQLIHSLERVPWFENVGKPVQGNVKTVPSWNQAIRYCKAIEWQSVQLQVNNFLGFKVNRADYSRFEAWNSVVVEIQAALNPLIEQNVIPLAERHALSKAFQNSVGWDLGMICGEIEYSDICQPIFFLEKVLPWYEAGHFPCGWDGPKIDEGWQGSMPNGRLIVF